MFKTDCFYANQETTKYSIKRISDEYMLYTEGVKHKFPGYQVNTRNYLIDNIRDTEVNLDNLKAFLVSKDL